ncbi:hypothetical protein HIM_03700 [Hirsutella minnesotensis 3608]|uniref:Uncharacterized protein n=1 Tax=Hirsutella minnesotensis 3608 TaxID=1043627 RepID=A0A0F7ZVL5_9HYPO|nr:hypothetical protein HIM_03700 [Hirsutella minnesotensis 3608]
MRTTTNGAPGDLAVNVDEAPPPPYSETDIYSNSGGPRTPITHAAPSCVSSNDDGASRQSSSAGEAILTPPETPRIASNPLLRSLPQPGASLYFESRPAPASLSLEPSTYTIDLGATSSPDDFPYQAQWAPRDVTPQDWATFVSYLLPDHTTRGNEAVMGRQVIAENQSGEASLSSGRPQAEAQLERLRGSSPDAGRRRADAEATVQQWNAAFFGPRGLHMQLLQPQPSHQIPGAWNPAFDVHPPPPWPAGPQQLQQQQIQRSRTWGGLTIGDDGIRYGNKFSADSSGLRVGSLVMDSNGIRMGNERLGGGPRPPVWPGPPQPPPWRPQVLLDDPICEPQHHRSRRQYEHVGGQHTGVERGRRHDPNPSRQRSASADSVSSTSSSVSSTSESSVGSLPNYDHVQDQQLPLYVARLESWVGSPDRLRYKSDVRRLRAELKEVKNSPDVSDIDKKALRARLKTLYHEWKVLKKQQKGLRKAARRERRQRRKAEKKERRQTHKEMRKAYRDRQKGKQSQAVPSPPRVPPVPRVPNAQDFTGPPPAYVPQHMGFGRQGGHGGGPFGHPAGAFGPPVPFGPPPGVPGPMGGRGSRGNGFWDFTGRSDLGVGPGPSTSHRAAPGAWPGDSKHLSGDHEAGGEPAIPPPGPASAAKYREADKIMAEMQVKARQATELEEGKARQALDDELEALTERLKETRMEADEEYARELAAQEGQ